MVEGLNNRHGNMQVCMMHTANTYILVCSAFTCNRSSGVSVHWTGLVDWTSGLTLELKFKHKKAIFWLYLTFNLYIEQSWGGGQEGGRLGAPKARILVRGRAEGGSDSERGLEPAGGGPGQVRGVTAVMHHYQEIWFRGLVQSSSPVQ